MKQYIKQSVSRSRSPWFLHVSPGSRAQPPGPHLSMVSDLKGHVATKELRQLWTTDGGHGRSSKVFESLRKSSKVFCLCNMIFILIISRQTCWDIPMSWLREHCLAVSNLSCLSIVTHPRSHVFQCSSNAIAWGASCRSAKFEAGIDSQTANVLRLHACKLPFFLLLTTNISSVVALLTCTNPPTPPWRWRRAYWGCTQQH